MSSVAKKRKSDLKIEPGRYFHFLSKWCTPWGIKQANVKDRDEVIWGNILWGEARRWDMGQNKQAEFGRHTKEG